MFKRCKCLFAFLALFAFGVAELSGFEAGKVLESVDYSDVYWEHAPDGDEEAGEDCTRTSGGSGQVQEDASPRILEIFTAASRPGRPHYIILRFAASSAAVAHEQSNLLSRVRPALFILFCSFSGALPAISF
jgi:hypothetical protein